jgi:hypothetical protein
MSCLTGETVTSGSSVRLLTMTRTGLTACRPDCAAVLARLTLLIGAVLFAYPATALCTAPSPRSNCHGTCRCMSRCTSPSREPLMRELLALAATAVLGLNHQRLGRRYKITPDIHRSSSYDRQRERSPSHGPIGWVSICDRKGAYSCEDLPDPLSWRY